MKPQYLSCKTCHKTIWKVGRWYWCDCGSMRANFSINDAIPDNWVVSVEALNQSYYEVLRLLAEGKTTKEVALHMGYKHSKVKRILEACRKTTRTRTTYELVARVAIREYRKHHFLIPSD